MFLGILVVFLSLNSFCSCSSQYGVFSNPPDGGTADYEHDTVWQIGSQQTLRYFTIFSSYSIRIYQQDIVTNNGAVPSNTIVYNHSASDPPTGTYVWAVAVPQDLKLSASPVFYIQVTNLTGGAAFTSQYFNMTMSAPANTTSSLAMSSTSSATSSPSNTGSSTNLPPGEPSSPSSTGLSVGEKAGIGVGVGLGVPILLLLGAFLGFQYHRMLQARNSSQTEEPFHSEGVSSLPPSSHYQNVHQQPMAQQSMNPSATIRGVH